MAIRYFLPKVMAILGLILPVVGFCKGVDVCHTPSTKEDNHFVVSNEPLSITVKLDCSQLGKKSLAELEQDGWSIVNVTYVGGHDPYNRNWMVVVERK